jgi:hypothetical protein
MGGCILVSVKEVSIRAFTRQRAIGGKIGSVFLDGARIRL